MQKNKKISEELKTEMHELHRDFHDLYPLHTPSNEEDRETGFGSVATEEEKADPVKATTEKKKLTPVFLLSLLIVAGLTAGVSRLALSVPCGHLPALRHHFNRFWMVLSASCRTHRDCLHGFHDKSDRKHPPRKSGG